MKLLFCILAISTACFATDYSQIDLIKHTQVGDEHVWLYYDYNTGKFFALLNDEDSPKANEVELMLDNSFLLSFKSAKTAFPFLKGYKKFYGIDIEDAKEMSVKNSIDSEAELPSQITETDS